MGQAVHVAADEGAGDVALLGMYGACVGAAERTVQERTAQANTDTCIPPWIPSWLTPSCGSLASLSPLPPTAGRVCRRTMLNSIDRLHSTPPSTFTWRTLCVSQPASYHSSANLQHWAAPLGGAAAGRRRRGGVGGTISIQFIAFKGTTPFGVGAAECSTLIRMDLYPTPCPPLSGSCRHAISITHHCQIARRPVAPQGEPSPSTPSPVHSQHSCAALQCPATGRLATHGLIMPV